jgi:hypothetical protein
LIDGLNYVHISGEGVKMVHNSIPSSILKGNIAFNVTETNIKKALELKEPRLA